jgi:hypothetical protein
LPDFERSDPPTAAAKPAASAKETYADKKKDYKKDF